MTLVLIWLALQVPLGVLVGRFLSRSKQVACVGTPSLHGRPVSVLTHLPPSVHGIEVGTTGMSRRAGVQAGAVPRRSM